MRTLLVNPTGFRSYNPKRRRAATQVKIIKVSATRRSPTIVRPNPQFIVMPPRHRRKARNRRRSRNAALLPNPMLMNPLILPNRRRRRRRNPAEFTVDAMVKHGGEHIVGGGVSYLLSKFLVSKIGAQDTSGTVMRSVVRALVGISAAILLPSGYGTAINGAMAYPTFSEFDQWWAAQSADSGDPNYQDPSTQDIETDLMDVLD